MTEVFYNEKMSVATTGGTDSTSKPKRFVRSISKKSEFKVVEFEPVRQAEFYLAHERQYVDGFFSGEGRHAKGSGIDWSPEFAESVRHTTASLYEAIKHAITYQKFTIAPVSGFHHATPKRGKMFCAMSGQVVASKKIFNETGARGAYVDLDSHFGNSIEDTRKFTDMSFVTANINPKGKHDEYKLNLVNALEKLLKDKPDYLVYCHGADSLDGDPLGHGQCTELEWFECTMIVADFAKMNGIPLVLCLFGGYFDPDKVVELHVQDAELIQKIYND